VARLYVPLSVSTRDDARLLRAGNDAELLWYRALQVAKPSATDGRLDIAQLRRISPRGMRPIEALEREGLLRRIDDTTFYLAGWLDWNESAEQNDARRQRDRQRKAAAGAKGNAARWTPESAQIPGGIQTESARIPSHEGKGREGKGIDTSTRTPRKGPDRPRDEILDSLALIDAPGGDLGEVTRSAWSHLAKIRRDLPAHVTADDIRARVSEYRRKHPTWDCTAAAVVKHWHTLAPRDAPKPACGHWTDGGDPARLPTVEDFQSGAYQRGPARF